MKQPAVLKEPQNKRPFTDVKSRKCFEAASHNGALFIVMRCYGLLALSQIQFDPTPFEECYQGQDNISRMGNFDAAFCLEISGPISCVCVTSNNSLTHATRSAALHFRSVSCSRIVTCMTCSNAASRLLTSLQTCVSRLLKQHEVQKGLHTSAPKTIHDKLALRH